MSTPTFAETLAETCVSEHLDEKGGGYVHLRNRDGVSVISAGLRAVHCPEAKALRFVRDALAGLIGAGIEEGRRQAGTPAPEALASAHEAGIAVGWTRALAVAIREVEAQQEGVDLLRRSLARGQDDLRVAEAVRNAISEAMPRTGGYDE
jgi:hypothetical protein